MEKLPYNIVYITDKPIDTSNIDLTNTTVEGNSAYASKKIFETISTICNKVFFYDDLMDFSENIHKHKKDIVLSTKYGMASANSKALVPAICEANDISYIGADSYSQMLCNDKYLSKRYALSYGISGARDIIIRRPESDYELSLLSTLKFPVVIKPNFGGGSTGISQHNVKYSLIDAMNFIKELYRYQNQPILVEEYIEGYEVELILLGTSSKIKFCHEIQLIMDGKQYFNNIIWGYETKKINDENITFKSSNYLNLEDITKLIRIFQSFSKIEFMRIDCRVNESGIKLIELSPDCYLGEDCAYSFAFQEKGISYAEMFYYIIKNFIDSKNT